MTSSAPSSEASSAQVLGVVSFYIFAAILMVTVNKWVLLSSQIPVFFLFCQLAIAVILLIICHFSRLLSLPRWDSIAVRKLWPLIVLNVLGLSFNNLCLQYVDASFYQIARGLVLPITVGLAFATNQGPPSTPALLCCIGITSGFGVGVLLDQHRSGNLNAPSFIGVTFGVLSSITTAAHSIVIKKSLSHVNNSAVQLAWYANLLSAFVTIPLVVAVGEIPGIFAMVAEAAQLRTFLWGTLVTGIVGFLICVAGFLSIKVTSPVTHMVSSALRGVVQTLLSVWVFGDVISGARTLSIMIIVLGSMAYVWVKHVEGQAAKNPTASSDPRKDIEDEVPLIGVRDKEDV